MALVVASGNAAPGGEEGGGLASDSERNRKRGRRAKFALPGHEMKEDLEILNINGVAVDLEALANAGDPYGEELRRRSAGLETEAEFLGFLKDLGGQWGSRRKKRKYVDASDIGDTLPVGWKLLIGLRRKAGTVSLYCRRYISPSGEHFESCKEASSYLKSLFGVNEEVLPMDRCVDNGQHLDNLVSGTLTVATETNMNKYPRQDTYSSLPCLSLSIHQEKDVSLLGIENLEEVQVQDLFECRKCNMTFDEKDSYLCHLLSSHRKTTRRYRLGSSVGDGVILKDGKYECQFCHKVFNERRRYNGHVGIHVRNYVRSSEEFPGRVTATKIVNSPSKDGLPLRISKMDALVEIAQNSILEASSAGPTDESNKFNMISNPDTSATISDDTENLSCHGNEPEVEGRMISRVQSEHEQDDQDSRHVILDKEMVKINNASNVGDINYCSDIATENHGSSSQVFGVEEKPVVDVDITDHSGVRQLKVCEIHTLSSIEQGNCAIENNMNVEKYGNSVAGSSTSNSIIMENLQRHPEGNVIYGDTKSSLHLSQSFPLVNSSQDKRIEFCGVDQNLDNATGFDELKLDEIEPLRFNFLANDTEMGTGFDASVQFESREIMLNMEGRSLITDVCVWCRMEFNHQVVSEIQSDSVGFMCPSCKAKISGQHGFLFASEN